MASDHQGKQLCRQLYDRPTKQVPPPPRTQKEKQKKKITLGLPGKKNTGTAILRVMCMEKTNTRATQADSWDEPAASVNKPIHPWKKVVDVENPWVAGQANTNIAEDENGTDTLHEVQAKLNDRGSLTIYTQQ